MSFTANRVISGTWGEIWLDGELAAEVYKCQAKASFTKDDIRICGQMAVDSKITGIKHTGSLGMHKVNTRMAGRYARATTPGLLLSASWTTRIPLGPSV